MRKQTTLRGLLTIVLLTFITHSAIAVEAKDFEAREYKDADGNVLLYRLFKPKDYDPARKYPLVLFLHGAGERGNNNLAQVRDALYFAKEAAQKENPCFVVAPQCPNGAQAFQVYGSSKNYNQSVNDYAASAGEWKSYTIVLSKLSGGPKSFLTIINAAENRRAPGNAAAAPATPVTSEFRNIAIGENGGEAPPVDLRKLSLDKKQGNGKAVVSEDGKTLTITGDLRLKIPFEYKVTEKTVLTFEFRASKDAQGSAHAIGLDNDAFFDSRWANIDWSAKKGGMGKEPATPLRLALEVVSGLQKEFSIDDKRLYLTGLSMGGYGTWDAISRYPKLFAAAVPICGGGDESAAASIKDIPIWCFHGGADPTVPTQRSRDMIKAIKDAGGNPKYTEYPGVGHNSWDKAYSEPELAKWLFAQKKD
jgi:poly(3-hydroxybutyrate) depolymerase